MPYILYLVLAMLTISKLYASGHCLSWVFYISNTKIKLPPPTILRIVLVSVIVYMVIIIYQLHNFPLNYILSKQNYILRAVLYQTGAVTVFALLSVLYLRIKSSFVAKSFIVLGQNTLGIYVMNEILIKLFKQHCAFIGSIPLWILSVLFTFVLLLLTLRLKQNKYTANYLLGEKI